jgi:cupin 2 domain-containing protein
MSYRKRWRRYHDRGARPRARSRPEIVLAIAVINARPWGMEQGNLFADLRDAAAEAEEVGTLLATPALRIERIVSRGQASPPGFWYDQGWAEWVLVLRGAADLLCEGEATPWRLVAGDFLHLPAHRRHRVEWTDPTEPTLWLAIHYHQG